MRILLPTSICAGILILSTAYTIKGRPKGVKTVVIDAGHGGKDPGCNGETHNEKDVTLAVALKLGKLIEENLKDVKVIYTRKTDVFVELEERAQIANRNEADLFISIHCNAASTFVTYTDKKGKKRKKEVHNPKPYGSETYVMGIKNEKGKLTVAKRENAAMLMEDNYQKTYNGFDPNSDEAYIIMSMWTGAFVEQSANFASKIQKEYINKAGRVDKGVQRQSIWVLWRTAMPSILTELGFLTNPEEEKFLGSEKGQKYLATSIFRAFRNYKAEVEGSYIKYNDEFENEEALVNENLVKGDTLKVKDEEKENKEDIELLEKYTSLVKQADEKFKERKYTEAKALYAQASELKPDELLPKEKIAEIDKAMNGDKAKQEEEDKAKAKKELEQKYTALIKKADGEFASRKLEAAKISYIEAAELKPGEKYPKDKIKEVDLALKQLADREEEERKKEEEEKNKNISAGDILKNYKDKTPRDSVKKNDDLAGNAIEFKVQFASSDLEIDDKSDKFKNLERVSHYKTGNVYKYTSGIFTNPGEAVKHQSKVRSLGYKDAFVAAFRNGQRIDYNQAIKQLNN
ncbi:MAG: N-acetylmuramoyl-L-alanine amidase [Bacteroidia bacterium]